MAVIVTNLSDDSQKQVRGHIQSNVLKYSNFLFSKKDLFLSSMRGKRKGRKDRGEDEREKEEKRKRSKREKGRKTPNVSSGQKTHVLKQGSANYGLQAKCSLWPILVRPMS